MYIVVMDNEVMSFDSKDVAETVLSRAFYERKNRAPKDMDEVKSEFGWKIIDNVKNGIPSKDVFCIFDGLHVTLEELSTFAYDYIKYDFTDDAIASIFSSKFYGDFSVDGYEDDNIAVKISDFYDEHIMMYAYASYRGGEKEKIVLAKNVGDAIEKAMDELDHYDMWEVDIQKKE